MKGNFRSRDAYPYPNPHLLGTVLRAIYALLQHGMPHGWDTNERNGTRLHQSTYQPLREAYPDLPAQLVVSARMKATETLKSVQERQEAGAAGLLPTV